MQGLTPGVGWGVVTKMTGHRDRADVKAKELRSEVRYCALPSVSMARREGGEEGRTGFCIVFHCVDVVGGGRLWDASLITYLLTYGAVS